MSALVHTGCAGRRAAVRLARVARRDEGQAVTEYGVVLGILIVALATTVLALNTGIGTFLGKVVTKVGGIIS